MNFQHPNPHYNIDELSWLTKDMTNNTLDQAQAVAAELRGYLVYVSSDAKKRGDWLRYDTQRKEWVSVKRWQVLDLIHTVTYAWFKAIQRTRDPKLIVPAGQFSLMTAAKRIYQLLPAYLPATLSNFIPADY